MTTYGDRFELNDDPFWVGIALSLIFTVHDRAEFGAFISETYKIPFQECDHSDALQMIAFNHQGLRYSWEVFVREQIEIVFFCDKGAHGTVTNSVNSLIKEFLPFMSSPVSVIMGLNYENPLYVSTAPGPPS